MFDFLGSMFVLGSVGFWILTVAAGILLLLATEARRTGWGIFILLTTAVLLGVCGNGDLAKELWQHPGMLAVFAVGYIVVGVAWSLVKWSFLAKDRLAAFEKFRLTFVPSSTWPTFYDYCQNRMERLEEEYAPPKPHQFKSQILTWMGFWPFSLFNFVCFDFFKRVFTEAFDRLKGVYESISVSIYGDAWKETQIKPTPDTPADKQQAA